MKRGKVSRLVALVGAGGLISIAASLGIVNYSESKSYAANIPSNSYRVQGDFDNDGDVDLKDYKLFVDCMDDCFHGDFNEDGKITLSDFDDFHTSYRAEKIKRYSSSDGDSTLLAESD